MQTPSYGFMECFLVHCLLCGQHQRGTNHYCATCMSTRFEDVEKDAKVRSLSGRWRILSGCTHTEVSE